MAAFMTREYMITGCDLYASHATYAPYPVLGELGSAWDTPRFLQLQGPIIPIGTTVLLMDRWTSPDRDYNRWYVVLAAGHPYIASELLIKKHMRR